MLRSYFVYLVFFIVLSGCSLIVQKPAGDYHLLAMQHLQEQKNWSLDGRLALLDDKDSVSLSIFWQHAPLLDELDLVGPLGQGRVKISVTSNQVVVDDGDSRKVFDGQANAVISEQLGVDLPIESLRYWVLGVSDPRLAFTEQPGGFYQAGWLIRYQELQDVNTDKLPRKMTAEKDKARIKIIVDQWILS